MKQPLHFVFGGGSWKADPMSSSVPIGRSDDVSVCLPNSSVHCIRLEGVLPAGRTAVKAYWTWYHTPTGPLRTAVVDPGVYLS